MAESLAVAMEATVGHHTIRLTFDDGTLKHVGHDQAGGTGWLSVRYGDETAMKEAVAMLANALRDLA